MNPTAKTLLFQTIDKIQGAYAPSTIRAYRSDFAEYIDFCTRRNMDTFPPNPLLLADFISYLSEKGVKSATIRRSIAGISTIYRLNRMLDPSKDPDVILAMKRMHRKLGRTSAQAQGITSDLLDRLISCTCETTRGIRNRALLLIAYDTLCRRSELVSLQIEDIKCILKDGIEHTAIFLRRSKTDQDSVGRWLHLSERAQSALKTWLTILNETNGPLFRSILSNHLPGRQLGSGQINRIYKQLAMAAKLDEQLIQRISGHSCRVGAAQDLLRSGASFPQLMSKGRWSKTDTVMRYVEQVAQSSF